MQLTDNYSAITDQITELSERTLKNSTIDKSLYTKYNVKRGLRDLDGKGVLTGLTEISEVQGRIKDENGNEIETDGILRYRGYNVEDIINGFPKDSNYAFEEVIYLLLFGELPSAKAFEDFKVLLANYRKLPTHFVRDIIMKAPSKDMMNTLARSVLTLYSYDQNGDDTSIENVLRQCLELISLFPQLSVYGYQTYKYYHDGDSFFIHAPRDDFSTSENILHMLRADSQFTTLEAKVLDMALVLHAEHGGGNNSSFTTHLVSSSGTDTYSTISAAVGSLKGPKHGGANIAVINMIEDIKKEVKDITDYNEVEDYLVRVLKKEANNKSGLVYGMGHAIYTLSDPRAKILKEMARKLAQSNDKMDDFLLCDFIETKTPELQRQMTGVEKPMCANVDLYSGFVYEALGIPPEIATPLFATARLSGWCAHRLEELTIGKKLMRPAYDCVEEHREYIEIGKR